LFPGIPKCPNVLETPETQKPTGHSNRGLVFEIAGNWNPIYNNIAPIAVYKQILKKCSLSSWRFPTTPLPMHTCTAVTSSFVVVKPDIDAPGAKLCPSVYFFLRLFVTVTDLQGSNKVRGSIRFFQIGRRSEIRFWREFLRILGEGANRMQLWWRLWQIFVQCDAVIPAESRRISGVENQWGRKPVYKGFDWCCFYYFVRNSLVEKVKNLPKLGVEEGGCVSGAGHFLLAFLSLLMLRLLCRCVWIVCRPLLVQNTKTIQICATTPQLDDPSNDLTHFTKISFLCRSTLPYKTKAGSQLTKSARQCRLKSSGKLLRTPNRNTYWAHPWRDSAWALVIGSSPTGRLKVLCSVHRKKCREARQVPPSDSIQHTHPTWRTAWSPSRLPTVPRRLLRRSSSDNSPRTSTLAPRTSRGKSTSYSLCRMDSCQSLTCKAVPCNILWTHSRWCWGTCGNPQHWRESCVLPRDCECWKRHAKPYCLGNDTYGIVLHLRLIAPCCCLPCIFITFIWRTVLEPRA